MKHVRWFLITILVLLLVLPTAAQLDDYTVRMIPITSRGSNFQMTADGHLLAMHEIGQIYAIDDSLAVDPTALPVRVYDLDAGELLYELSGPPDFPREIAFSADGSALAAYYEVGWIYLWNMADGSLINRIATVPSMGKIAFVPDSNLLVQSGSSYPFPMVIIYDTETGYIVSTVLNRFLSMAAFRQVMDNQQYFPVTLTEMRMLSDGETLLASTSLDNVIRWNLITGEQITLVGNADNRPYFGVTDIEITHDEQAAVVVNLQRDTIIVVDLATQATQEYEFDNIPAGASALIDDQTLIYLTGERDAEMLNIAPLSDISNGEQVDLRSLVDLPEGIRLQGLYLDMAASMDGNRIVLAGFFASDELAEDNLIVVLDRGSN
ncbi:MAG: WD40 repeat domain-containing protein [Anaerolineaceae bacterium]|nr:WD40 repeat domain-containing protein [Anaerolineaceae bacterium]